MLKRMVTLCLSLAVCGMLGYGRQDSHLITDKTSSYVTGTVITFAAGKTIEVEANGTLHKYDLTKPNASFEVSPDVKTGSNVMLKERTDADGRTTITIEPRVKAKEHREMTSVQ